jgi:chemotaxis protein MotA
VLVELATHARKEGMLPMSVKIQRNSDLRAAEMAVLVEGVIEIVAGTNPRALRVRLQSMLRPSEARNTAA